MRSIKTNIYEELINTYPDFMEKYKYNPELKLFIDYNTHNIDIDGCKSEGLNYTLYSPTIRDDAGLSYLLIGCHGSINEEEIMSFAIGQSAICLRVNQYGFFLENFNLSDYISTAVYDGKSRNIIGGDIPDVIFNLLKSCDSYLNRLTTRSIFEKYVIEPDFTINMKKSSLQSTVSDKVKICYYIDYLIDEKMFDSEDYYKYSNSSSENNLYNEYVKFMQQEGYYKDIHYPPYIKTKYQRIKK